MKLQIDNIDRKILREIQINSNISVHELGEKIGLSGSACHRRIKTMEEQGLIKNYKAVLDSRKLGFQMMFFIQISLTSQSEEALKKFEKAIANVPEVLSCYLMAGHADFLLQLICRDQEDFERLHKMLITRLPGVSQIHSNLRIRTLKEGDILPV